jgi:hypothetical protein
LVSEATREVGADVRIPYVDGVVRSGSEDNGREGDELALEFDDEFWRVREAIAADSASSLVALDAQLLRMSGAENAELWRPEALEGPDCRWPRWLPQPPPSEVRWGSA